MPIVWHWPNTTMSECNLYWDPAGFISSFHFWRSENQWKVFTGNEIGALLGWWSVECFKRQNPGKSLSDCYMLASTVSSKMLRALANAEGLNFIETLTGFKWMGKWCAGDRKWKHSNIDSISQATNRMNWSLKVRRFYLHSRKPSGSCSHRPCWIKTVWVLPAIWPRWERTCEPINKPSSGSWMNCTKSTDITTQRTHISCAMSRRLLWKSSSESGNSSQQAIRWVLHEVPLNGQVYSLNRFRCSIRVTSKMENIQLHLYGIWPRASIRLKPMA